MQVLLNGAATRLGRAIAVIYSELSGVVANQVLWRSANSDLFPAFRSSCKTSFLLAKTRSAKCAA